MTLGTVKHQDSQTVTWKTKTNSKTHDVVRANLDKSIHIRESVRGPRYCPSLESKIIKFGHKQSHVVWLEPEGYPDDTGETVQLILLSKRVADYYHPILRPHLS